MQCCAGFPRSARHRQRSDQSRLGPIHAMAESVTNSCGPAIGWARCRSLIETITQGLWSSPTARTVPSDSGFPDISRSQLSVRDDPGNARMRRELRRCGRSSEFPGIDDYYWSNFHPIYSNSSPSWSGCESRLGEWKRWIPNGSWPTSRLTGNRKRKPGETRTRSLFEHDLRATLRVCRGGLHFSGSCLRAFRF